MTDCGFDHPHPDHPCAKKVIVGVTYCTYCGNLDGDPACRCWIPATEAHLDALYAEAWGVADLKSWWARQHNDGSPDVQD